MFRTIRNNRRAIALFMCLKFKGVMSELKSEQHLGETIYYGTFKNGKIGVIYTTLEKDRVRVWDSDEYCRA